MDWNLGFHLRQGSLHSQSLLTKKVNMGKGSWNDCTCCGCQTLINPSAGICCYLLPIMRKKSSFTAVLLKKIIYIYIYMEALDSNLYIVDIL